MRSPRRGTSGQAAIEGAVGALLMLTITFAAVDYGQMIWHCQAMQQGAQDGTLFASMRGKNAADPDKVYPDHDGGTAASQAIVRTFVRDRLWGLGWADTTVTTTWENADGTANGTGEAGTWVRVVLDHPLEATVMKTYFPSSCAPKNPCTGIARVPLQ